VLLLQGNGIEGINNYRSWPKFRPGYDMPFRRCVLWNKSRFINPSDEPYFERTDYPKMEKEIRTSLHTFIEQLGGK